MDQWEARRLSSDVGKKPREIRREKHDVGYTREQFDVYAISGLLLTILD